MQWLGILGWWSWAQLLGLLALPFAFQLFPHLPDRGYSLSKPLGLLLLGLCSWWLGFWHFGPLMVWGLLLLFLAASVWNWKRQVVELRAFLLHRLTTLLRLELFFLLVFLGYLAFRAFDPAVLGTEKIMDCSFLAGLTRADQLPPFDPWLAGPDFHLSYYYFGYLLMSLPLKLSGLAPAFGYNLSLGLLFALTSVAVFGLLWNLTQRTRWALSGWTVVMLLGTWAGVQSWWSGPAGSAYNWFMPTRIMPNTITEFPFFSFLLGDMHPHMLVVPWALTVWSLALNQLLAPANTPGPSRRMLLLWGVLIGAVAFLNPWDLPVALGLSLCSLGFRAWLADRSGLTLSFWLQRAQELGWLVIGGLVPFLPFYAFFHSQVNGVGWTDQASDWPTFLLAMGPLLLMALVFLGGRVRLEPPPRSERPLWKQGIQWLQDPAALLRPHGPWSAAVIFLLVATLSLAAAFLRSPLLLVLGPALAVAAWLVLRRNEDPIIRFALCLVTAGLLLLAIPEVLYVRDYFPPRLHRMNTVFKFYYQAWYLLGIGGMVGAFWLSRKLRRPGLWLAAAGLVGLSGLVYPLQAVWSKTQGFSSAPTLDGSAYLQTSSLSDWLAIEWMRQNIPGHPCVLEAIGPQFSQFARVAAYTGLPNLLGWPGHELQWRGDFSEPGRRIDAIDQVLLGSSDPVATWKALREFDVRYVFIGSLEQGKYTVAHCEKYLKMLPIVYTNGETTIYAVPPVTVPSRP